MILSNRRKLYTDVIPFPDSKSAGAATISSDELYPFEGGSPGSLDLHLVAADDAKITDTLSVNLNVSYDGGSSWLEAVSYTDLANGSAGTISAHKSAALSIAPRVRLDGAFDSLGALDTGHGAAVHANFFELGDTYRYEIASDIVTISTLGTNSSITGDTVSVSNSVASPIEKVVVVSYVGDKSKITDDVTWVLQSSYDGTYWWDVSTSAEADILNGTGTSFTEVEESDDLGDYFRVVVSSNGTGEIAADHGIQFNLISLFA